MKDQGRFLKKYRGNECLNCGVPLDVLDRYCHNCGQVNTTKRLSLKDFFDEFFASIFSYDSRLRHTMMALLFKPGKISKDYINGQRAKYANPFRFYLSVSIIFFIINGFFLDFDSFSDGFKKDSKIETKALKVAEDVKPEKIREIEEKNNISLDSLLRTRDSISDANKKERVNYTESELDTMNSLKAAFQRFSMYRDFYEDTNIHYPETALDSLNHQQTVYNEYIYRRGIKAANLEDNPEELFKYIFDKLPFIIFFFLPFLALAIWLVYVRRPFTYMEHLVFTFHTQTIFFILMGIAILVEEIVNSDVVTSIAILLFLFYLYKAMRKFYGQGRFKTIVKFLIINHLFFILALIGVAITFAGSILLF